MCEQTVTTGDRIAVTIDRLGHGGVGIGTARDGRVVFVDSAYPGDQLEVEITKTKKSFLQASIVAIDKPSAHRVASSCPAASAGAGCCDFATLDPEVETELKIGVARDQIQRIARVTDSEIPEIEAIELKPRRGWRTRVRLGVDSQGRAGLRKKASRELVTDVACTQLAPGLVEGIVGDNARRFSPGAEIVAVLDSTGTRHVVEIRKVGRGRRAEKITDIIEGSGQVTEVVDGRRFEFPATAFWQAHRQAPEVYSNTVSRWLATVNADGAQGVGWDLYGGVGLFSPAIAGAIQSEPPASTVVHSVDMSPTASDSSQPGLSDLDVVVHQRAVEDVISTLPAPAAVVLDPPRKGAGEGVISTIAAAKPESIVHLGCDPATFARDLTAWHEGGYHLARIAVCNAFPGTHHFEIVALLETAK